MHITVAKNTFYQLLTKIVSSGIGLIITLIIARSLGASGYGDFTKVIATVTLFYLLIDFGINAKFIQQISFLTNLSNLLLLRTAIAVVIAVFINIAVWIISGSAYSLSVRLGILLYSLTFLTQAIVLSTSAIFQKQHSYQKLFISTAIGSVIPLVIVVGGFKFLSVQMVLLSLVIGSSISASVSLQLLHYSFAKHQLSFRFARKLFSQSLPLGTMLSLNLIYAKIDVIILGFFVSAAAVGVYGLAYRFFDFFLTLPLFLSNALYPFLLSGSKNTRNVRQIASKYLLIYALFGLITAAICFLAADLIGFIKADFLPSVLAFRILILSLPLFFVTSLLQWVLIAKNKLRFLLLVYLLAAIINIVLNIIFIPQYGYLAAAVITDFSEAVVFLLLVFYSYWHKFI